VRNELADRDPDALIARIAARQHGVISTAQLRLVGLSHTGINRRMQAGRLHRRFRGVYAVGHTGVSTEGEWMAAVLACGEGAVLSHRSAAELWGMMRRDRRQLGAGGRGRDVIDVTLPSNSGRSRRKGIALHHSLTLTPEECTREQGIPVTRPGRTLEDLRRVVSAAVFGAAVKQAEFLRLRLGTGVSSEQPRSELEARVLALCRGHRLPQPEVNVKIDRFEVDFLWREARLIVEVDGWRSHGSRSAFEADRARDARLTLLGFRVVRFTWRQISNDGPGVAKTIRALLMVHGT
jgi:very-short-patch-repair endonuclease